MHAVLMLYSCFTHALPNVAQVRNDSRMRRRHPCQLAYVYRQNFGVGFFFPDFFSNTHHPAPVLRISTTRMNKFGTEMHVAVYHCRRAALSWAGGVADAPVVWSLLLLIILVTSLLLTCMPRDLTLGRCGCQTHVVLSLLLLML